MRILAAILLAGAAGALAAVAPPPAPAQDAGYEVNVEPVDVVFRPGKPARLRVTFANFQEKAVDVPVPDDVLDGLSILKPDGSPLRTPKEAVPSKATRTLQKGEYFGRAFEVDDFVRLGDDDQGFYQLVWRNGAKTSVASPVVVLRDYVAKLQTTMGDVKFELYPEIAPRTVVHFVSLVRQGVYKDSSIHRVIKDFVMQGGRVKSRPEKLPGEFGIRSIHEEGSVAMAQPAGDPDGAMSEFYITFRRRPELDRRYAVFGRVIEGLDVLHRIENVKTDHDACPSCGGSPCNAKELHCGKGHDDAPVDLIIKDITLEARK